MFNIVFYTKSGKYYSLEENPKELEIKGRGSDYRTYNVLADGEVLQMGNRRLREIHLEFFLPHNKNPYNGLDFFNNLYETKESFTLIMEDKNDYNGGKVIYMPMVLEDFSYSYKGGLIGDIYIKLGLIEDKAIKLRHIGGVK